MCSAIMTNATSSSTSKNPITRTSNKSILQERRTGSGYLSSAVARLFILPVLLSNLFSAPGLTLVSSTDTTTSHYRWETKSVQGRHDEYCTTSRHVHLSTLQDSSTSIIISFSSHPCDIILNSKTGDTSVEKMMPPSIGAVLIGTDPSSKEKFRLVIGTEKPQRYNATIRHNDGRKYEYWSEYQHHVTIQDLQPDTTYYYKCIVLRQEDIAFETIHNEFSNDGDDDDIVDVKEEARYLRKLTGEEKGEVFSFRTSPMKGTEQGTKVVILGDLGVFDHTKEMLSVLSSRHLEDITSIILVGDISYANGFHRIWDSWFDMMDSTKILQKKPMYISPGNHDVEGDLETGAMYQSYEARFRMPRIQQAIIGRVTKPQDIDLNKMYGLPYDYGNSYYSYTSGMVYNIVLNSFANFEPGSNQHTWLTRELASVDRRHFPWLMVAVHCPIYNTFSKHRHDPQPIAMKRYLEPLFVTHRVNFVVSGHIHAYFRSKNVAYDIPTRTGPIHIVLGNGGREANAPFYSEDAEDWVAVRDNTTYGYGTINFLNRTTALYEWIQTGSNHLDGGMNLRNEEAFNLTDIVSIHNQYYL